MQEKEQLFAQLQQGGDVSDMLRQQLSAENSAMATRISEARR